MTSSAVSSPASASIRRNPRVADGVLGMLIFVITEVMFFAGLISAHTITRASATMGWPPPGQPRLPIESTAFNTAALILSGVLVLAARRTFDKDRANARVPFAIAIFLGAFFVLAQGVEWISLLHEGLTLTSSPHGSFFYLIVGTHALHAIVALGVLLWGAIELNRDRLTSTAFSTIAIFWSFVVVIWPFLYLKVYL